MTERVASLDLLRGVAAVSVAVPHFFMYFGSGNPAIEAISTIAVEIFFVLSGFVLGPQILLAVGGRARYGLGTFLVRRWMRTVPPYLVALIMVSALFGAIGSRDFLHYLFYIQNLYDQNLRRDYYPVAWSLSVEEWFYVGFPLFLLMMTLARQRPPINHAVAALVFIALIMGLRTLLGHSAAWGAGVRRVVAFRVDSIAFGFLLFLWVSHRTGRAWRPLSLAIILLCLGGLMFAILLHIDGHVITQAVYPLAAAAFGSACVAFFLSLDPVLRSRAIRNLSDLAGRTSYAIYLFHLLVIYVLSTHCHGWSVAPKFVVFCIATVVLALVSSYLLEQPILTMRPRYTLKHAQPLSVPSRTTREGLRREGARGLSQSTPSLDLFLHRFSEK
jgi:peptidoglycan/LPS O-acetylase OafA/YrhL